MRNEWSSETEETLILVVEDSPTQAEQLRFLLEQNDYVVAMAKNGTEALGLLAARRPAAVITDIVMPEMNGLELCKHIKSDETLRDIPVILQTSLSRSENVLDAVIAGADGFVTKPYADESLLARLSTVLASKRSQKENVTSSTITVQIGDREQSIVADGQQMLNLLTSAYDTAIQQNAELRRTQEELHELNARLEELVEERTQALSNEVTERKRAEERERLVAAEWQTTFEAIQDAVWLLDREFRIVRCNKATERLLRRPAEKLLGTDCWQVFHGTQTPPSHCLAERLRTSLQRETIEDQIGERWYRASADPVLDENGALVGIVHIVSDITERKEAEAERERLLAALEEALGLSRRRERHVNLLLDSASAVLDCDTFEAAARRVFDACREALGAAAGYVALLSKDSTENDVLFLEPGGMPCDVDPDLPMPTRGLREEAYRRGAAVYENDFSHSEWVRFLPDRHVALENVLFAPLLIEGKAVGLLGLANKSGGFTDEDARLAFAFGQQAATALRNIRNRDALRASEELLNETGDMARVGGWEIDLETDAVYWTEATRRIHEVPDEYAPTLDEALAFFPGEDRQRIANAVQRARDCGESYEMELRFVSAKGEPLWVRAAGKPSMQDGKCVRLHGTFQDITEQRNAEERIERLSRFPQENPSPVLRILADGVIEYANEPAACLLEDMKAGVGRQVSAKWMTRLRDALSRKKALYLETKIGKRSFGLTFVPVSSHGYVNIYGLDITERKRAEDALHASESKFRSIVDNIGIGISLIDREMRVLEVNRTMREWFPQANPSAHPLCYHVFNEPPTEDVCAGCPTARSLRTGSVCESEKEVVRDNRKQIFRIITSPLLDEDGEVVAAIEMVEDITERLSLAEQLHQAQKMEAVGQLAGGVAHDFNNILQAMLGYGSMLMDRLDKETEEYECADEIVRSTDRAAALTRQLLAFSRRQILEMEDLDLNDVIQGVMKMLRRVIGENIEVEIMEGRRLGSIHADAGQMEQVLLNLCVNARDAMPDGGRITIDTENVVIDQEYCDAHAWATRGRYVLLSVTDTGCGMDAETQARIFEPFFTTKELGKGTGLGLATVYGIVRQHNGMIQVYSEVDKGTTFKIYMPSVERPAVAVEPRVAKRVEGGSETILVAEDDENLRKLTSRILAMAGYTVLLAVDGEDALKRVHEHAAEITLVMLDVVMPKMGGKAVYDALKGHYPHLRFLFSSGYSSNAIHTGFVLNEGIELIQKPFAPDALLRKVREVLDQPKDSWGGE